MSVLTIIPARMASSRLPGKPLALLGQVPMVVCVARAATLAGFEAPIIAAAEDQIVAAAAAYGVRAVLTDAHLPSGSDRVRAAALIVDPEGAADVVVNVQGDMPELMPVHVRSVVSALQANPQADIATLAFESFSAQEREDENVVKVILETPKKPQKSGQKRGQKLGQKPPQKLGPRSAEPIARALSFTRAAPPHSEKSFYHHIGIYAYRRAALDRFCALPPSSAEKRERLEQLRALDAGMQIVCALVDDDCPGIDSPEDLARLRARLTEA